MDIRFYQYILPNGNENGTKRENLTALWEVEKSISPISPNS